MFFPKMFSIQFSTRQLNRLQCQIIGFFMAIWDLSFECFTFNNAEKLNIYNSWKYESILRIDTCGQFFIFHLAFIMEFQWKFEFIDLSRELRSVIVRKAQSIWKGFLGFNSTGNSSSQADYWINFGEYILKWFIDGNETVYLKFYVDDYKLLGCRSYPFDNPFSFFWKIFIRF